MLKRPALIGQRCGITKPVKIERLNGIYGNILKNAGVELIDGYARVIDKHTVAVGDKRYSAERILVATGGKPFIPDFPGKELAISSDEAFYLEAFPNKAVVVGGGYIAVEFAGIFAGLGADTTLSYRRDLFLRGFDGDLRETLRDEMQKKHNMTLRFNSTVKSLKKLESGRILVTWNDGSTEEADTVLYATGRVPNTKGIGLDEVGVAMSDSGVVQVNDNFQTSVDSIYALGDVIDRFQFDACCSGRRYGSGSTSLW